MSLDLEEVPISGVIDGQGETLTLYVGYRPAEAGYQWRGDRGTVSPRFPWSDDHDAEDDAFEWLETR